MVPDLPGTGMATIAFAAALGYALLAVVSHVRRAPLALVPYTAALLATGLWLALTAAAGPGSITALLGEAVRNLAWLWFMAAIAGRHESGRRISPLGWIYVGLCGVQALIAAMLILSVVTTKYPPVFFGPALSSLQMLFAAGALVLVHNLVEAGRVEERRTLTMPLAAICKAFMVLSYRPRIWMTPRTRSSSRSSIFCISNQPKSSKSKSVALSKKAIMPIWLLSIQVCLGV